MNAPEPRASRFPRIWFTLVVLGLAYLWLFSSQVRQMQFIFTYAAVLLSALIFAVRWFFGRGRSTRSRVLALVGCLLAVFAIGATVNYRGMTGDWVPILEWKWAERTDWSDRNQSRVAELEQVLPVLEEESVDPGIESTQEVPQAPTESVEAAPEAFPGAPAQVVVPTVDLSSPAAFPGFLGPNNDFSVTGLRLARDWDVDVPRRVWTREIGAGWSGFSIVDGRAYTIEQRGDYEVVVAYDLESGEELWLHSDEAYFTNPMAGPGPRATPTLDETTVYTFGSTGLLNALDRLTGRLLWRHHTLAEGGRLPEHGYSGSPLLVGDLVVVSIGGAAGRSLVAYDRKSGEEVWAGGDDHAGYPGPTLATLAGVRQILVFNGASAAGHSVDDGRVLWQYPWSYPYPNVATPLVIDADSVLYSTGYGVGAKLLRLSAAADGSVSVQLVWESPRMKAKFTNLILHEGYVYGLDDGVMVCLDPQTGERMWKGGRYGHGSILLVGDDLLVQTEKGELIMLEPNPQELREITRFTPLPGKAWNHFALVEPFLLVRNDREAALWQMPLG